ncbi:MAG TPA: glycosyltransferase [Trebonia sp.]|jgi:UDP:flavonoid glycosyltransferase YjiC (YdhE family)|nr:glycosyltransferase [Trebonia sp.]
MRVLMTGVGSRGDVAPLAGLGTALRAAGHDVSIAAYGNFQDLVTRRGLGFRLVPGDPERLGASDKGQKWQEGGGGPLSSIRFLRLIAAHMREVNAAILEAARQDTDLLLAAGMGMFGGYRIADGLGLPSVGLGLQPLHPTREFLPAALTTRSLGPWGNRALARAMMPAGIGATDQSSKPMWAEAGMPGYGGREMLRRQDAARWPFFYGYSPAVVPRPADWREGIEVPGYWWPPAAAEWTPPPELERFLAAGPPPVFVGFGSRNPADAGRLTGIVAAARRQAGVRMVIQAGWANLGAELREDDDVIVIGEAPHEWLFPKMAAVVHHAGAGTTGAGLRAGVPTVSVPMITDQPFWARRINALGAGPAAVPYKKLGAEALGAAIKDAVTRESYRERAQAISQRLAREDGTLPVIRAVNRLSDR